MGGEERGKRKEEREETREPGSRGGVPPGPPLPRSRAGLGLGPGREFDLIRGFFPGAAPAPRPDVRVGVGDDCAVVAGDGIALSCDVSVEGVHFRRDWLSDAEIGYRAATAALSDLAAVAARPIGVLAALVLPEVWGAAAAARLMEGVAAAAARAGAVVLGGDVSRIEGPLVVDVTAVGEARRPVLRGGARPGDEVWVTGELGAAAAAVSLLGSGRALEAGLRERFAAPVARTREALWLLEQDVPHAMIDLSDGLAGDAGHLAAASGVALVLDLAAVPVHPAVRRAVAPADEARRLALGGGEDYELCFTAAPGRVEALVGRFQHEFDVPLTRVGRVEAGEGVLAGDGERRAPLGLGGFQHFGGEP